MQIEQLDRRNSRLPLAICCLGQEDPDRAIPAEELALDIRIEDHGSIVLLRPCSGRATEWLLEHVDPSATYFGSALVVEPRYVADIVEGAVAAGLVVR